MDFINFTDPFYDELFYSTLTRYYQEFSEIPFYQAREELYGKTWPRRPRIYLASHLGNLVQRLGPTYSVESILMNHTVFPYFRPFLTKEKRDKVIASTVDNGAYTSRSIGMSSLQYEHFRYLKYCPSCAQSDYDVYSEGFFHVRHHLPGIDVCPVHGCWLEIYPLHGNEYPTRNYVPFDYSRINKQARICQDKNEVALARCAQELLEYQDDSLCQEEMLEILYKHLRRNGYVYPNGVVKVKKLHSDLLEFYSEEFLRRKDSLVEYNGNNRRKEWLTWYRSSFNRNIAPHQFLLLVVMLAGDFKTFLSIRDQPEETQGVEFCCLNPVCPNFNQSVSQERVSTVYCETIVKHVIRCSCGMVYSVRSDNQKPFLLQYGNLWFEEYQKLTLEGLSRAEIAERLGITVNTVKNIRRQKEEFNPVILDETISKHRFFLLELLGNNPGLTRKELSLIPGGGYQFLKAYDQEWLNEILPPLKGPRNSHSQKLVDYDKMDEEYLKAIPEVVLKLKETDPDYRITQSAILRELNITSQCLNNLPLTNQAVQESVETKEEFNLRKGYAVINSLIENQEKVTLRRLKIEGIDIFNPKIKQDLLKYLETIYP